MPNHAQCTLIGHIGQDPELKQVGDSDVVTFSIATNTKRRDEDITTWWRCTVWGKRASVIQQYCKKGDALLVTGVPMLSQYESQEGGMKQALDVRVTDFTFLGKRNQEEGEQRQPSNENAYAKARDEVRPYLDSTRKQQHRAEVKMMSGNDPGNSRRAPQKAEMEDTIPF